MQEVTAHSELTGTPVFLDFGANIGYHSLCVASHKWDTVSVEALPRNFGALWGSIEGMGWQDRMQAFNIALSDGSSEVPLCFKVAEKNLGGSSAVDPAKHKKGWHKGVDCTYVDVTTVDKVMAAANKHLQAGDAARRLCPVVMKLDVEGFEHFTLQGAAGLLGKYKPCTILMEFHVPLLRAAGAAPPMETVELLESYGYTAGTQRAKIEKAAVTGGILELVFEHATVESSGPSSCWAACMPPAAAGPAEQSHSDHIDVQ